MAGVYVFDRDDVDLDTTGLVGDLQPLECKFHEEKNGQSYLTMTLCYDELHKWAAVKVGSYIKAKVPVRVPPRIVNSVYTTDVTTYRVKDSVTKYATVYESTGVVGVDDAQPELKALFSTTYYDNGGVEQKKVKVKKKLKAGSEVQLLEERDEKCKIYASGFGTGWTLKSNLEATTTQVITDSFYGVEGVTDAVRLQYQLFQVTSIEQTLDHATVTAQHVFYELLTGVTSYKSDAAVEASAAIQGIFSGMVSPDERFTCLTDTRDTAGALDWERTNVVQALLDPENGLCARFGLSLIRDNYDMYALKNVGSDRGFVVEYGKNMLAVDRTEDISDVITRIIPFGKTKKGELVYLDGVIYVDSPHIKDYAMPRTMYLDCSDTATESKSMSLAQVKAELRARAQSEFDAGCDLPALSMTVDFISLGDTEEYKQYKDLDKVYLFDRITVKDKIRGYNYNAEVVAIDHNVLTGMLESVTLGSIRKGTGVRKIATWQVPEVDGGNIRLESIGAGVLAGGAVSEENMQDGSVSSRVIIARSVTTEKLDAGAVTADTIAARAIQAVHLDANAVTADKIDAGAVTAEKIDAKAVTTEKIATGAITADSGIIADSAIGASQIADASITDAKIVGLTASKITAGTIDAKDVNIINLKADNITTGTLNGMVIPVLGSDKLAAGAVTGEKIAENAVTADKIVSGAVTTDKLAANAVTANKILAGAVTTDKLSASAVTADKIAAGAITVQKVSSDFGSSLDLSSNDSIQLAVQKVSKPKVQYREPDDPATGDIWVRMTDSRTWETAGAMTWAAAKESLWGEIATSELPQTYIWNGTKWILTSDENLATEVSRITQTQSMIDLRVQTIEGSTPDELINNAVTIDKRGVKITGGEVDIQAGSSLRIRSGGVFTLESEDFSVGEDGDVSMKNAVVSGNLSQDGYSVLTRRNLIISSTEPAGKPDMVWVKPVSNVALTYAYGIAANTSFEDFNTARQMALQGSPATATAATVYRYTLSIPYKVTGTASQTRYLTARISNPDNSAQVVTFTAELSNVKGFVGFAEMTVESPYWLGELSAVNLQMELLAYSTSEDYDYHRITPGSIQLICVAAGSSSSGWSAAEVYVYQ